MQRLSRFITKAKIAGGALLLLLSVAVQANEREQLIKDEGVKFEVYKDSVNVTTGGIGHNLQGSGFRVGDEIRPALVYYWFEKDYAEAERVADKFAPNAPDEVRDILINMAFNLGEPRLFKFVKLRAAIKKGDWFEAAKEMEDSRWYRTVSNRAERLIDRMLRFGYGQLSATVWRQWPECGYRINYG